MNKLYAATLLTVVFLVAPTARAEEKKWSEQAELSCVKTEASKDYNVISETALISALNSKIFAQVSYTVNYDQMPVPATLDHTGTILARPGAPISRKAGNSSRPERSRHDPAPALHHLTRLTPLESILTSLFL